MSPADPCILVVDDSEELRDLLVETLRGEGCQVLAASNGTLGLQALSDGARPQLILLDMRMPEMDGAQFVQRLRAVPAYAALNVVLMSATLADLPEGMQGRLRKPFDLEELLALVDQYCPTRDAGGSGHQLAG